MSQTPSIKQDQQVLKQVLKFSRTKNRRLYIVGGFLRDIILGRAKANPDIDLVIKKDAIKFTAGLAKQLKAGFVVLDEDNGCARLVKKMRERTYTLDFTDFRGRDIEEDLSKRDFTINAMAVELSRFLENYNGLPKSLARILIDPLKGLADLKARIIKMVNAHTFDDDPLRVLRAFSLSSLFNFKINPATLELAKRKRNKLRTVSFERIRDELFKILTSLKTYESLVELDKHRILELIIPEIKPMYQLDQGPYHHLDVWGHTLETVKQLEKVIKDFRRSQDIQAYLDEEISSRPVYRSELIKLGGFMHDIAKPETLQTEGERVMFHGHEHVGVDIFKQIARRLKLSNNEIAAVKKMILLHLRPGYMADLSVLTRRAKFRFFHSAANEAVSVLLISLADQRATKGALATAESRRRHERLVRRLIKEYFQKKKEKKPERLIDGNDLIKSFRLKPSPLIGRILSEIEEAQAIGKLKTKKQALKLAKQIIKAE